jgi:biotin synthase
MGQDWNALADRVLEGHRLSRDEALAVLRAPDDDLLFLMHAAFRVRKHHHGRDVRVHVLRNAKSGACPEDCGFCSQSVRFDSSVDRYSMQTADELVAGAQRAVRMGAVMYCMVTATRGPSAAELDAVCDAVRRIKAEFPKLGICTSLGLLKPGQAEELAGAGVNRYNHNLETSARFFPEIVGSHGFEDRVATVRYAKQAGLEACCGGILGMGETEEDRIDLAFALRELEVESVPVNFLNPRPGTPLGDRPRLTPQECLKALAMFRFVHPSRDVRISAGREVCLGTLQPLALYAANSFFTDGYLTTEGQGTHNDWVMIEQAGFVGAVAW